MSAGEYQGTPLKLMEVGVILILCFLIAAFLIAFSGALVRPTGREQRTMMIANARSISQAIMGAVHDPAEGHRGLVPLDYPGHSRDVLTTLVADGALAVDASFFGGAGVPRARGPVDGRRFTAEHNAWRIVAGLTVDDPPTHPLVISRNLDSAYTNLSAQVPTVDKGRDPFRSAGLVVATIDGGARFIEVMDLPAVWHQLYDPATIQLTRILPE